MTCPSSGVIYRPPPPEVLPKANHKIHIISDQSSPYIQWIAQRVKTAEGRINWDVYQRMKEGETICFYNAAEEYVVCKIVYKHPYESFREMIEKEGLDKLLPSAKTIDEGVRTYESFPGAGRVHQFGVVAIGLEPIKSQYSS